MTVLPTAALLAGTADGRERLRDLLTATVTGLAAGAEARGGPIPAGGPAPTSAAVTAALSPALPEDGEGDLRAITDLVTVLAAGSADPADPACAAHLHCPPLAVAVAADAAVSALNPSLDSWDQSPASSAIEENVLSALAELVGYAPAESRGVITTGGTGSNLMGLLFARRQAGLAAGHDLSTTGLAALGDQGWRPVIFCSEIAHFSVQRCAGLLGLGETSVVPVPVDADARMRPAALAAALERARSAGAVPVAVVATAGTTDLGSIDPLPEIADVVRAASTASPVWLHVDAAYGGGALFSDRLRGLLSGVEQADSVSLDLHKYGWQPAAAGVFLTRHRSAWHGLDREVAYLNAADDTAAGLPDLLGRSLRTTRRPDAFKIAVTLRALGRRGIGDLVDRCHDLALVAADAIERNPRLELAVPPTLSTVVFRYRPAQDRRSNAVNAGIRRRLLHDGSAVVGRADLGPSADVHLKLTLLNPAATSRDVEALLSLVVAAGEAEEDGR
jgi:L-2,4-diaminobutyrate decarboxylase